MKFLLMLVLCHGGDCTPPVKFPKSFNTYYDCAMTGYEASILKFKELGPDKVEENRTTVLFMCEESKEI